MLRRVPFLRAGRSSSNISIKKAEYRMLKNSINCKLLQCRVYRLLFLLFLAFFVISPIADAYTDSLCPSLSFFNDLNDADSPVSINDLKLNDALSSLDVFKISSIQK